MTLMIGRLKYGDLTHTYMRSHIHTNTVLRFVLCIFLHHVDIKKW